MQPFGDHQPDMVAQGIWDLLTFPLGSWCLRPNWLYSHINPRMWHKLLDMNDPLSVCNFLGLCLKTHVSYTNIYTCHIGIQRDRETESFIQCSISSIFFSFIWSKMISMHPTNYGFFLQQIYSITLMQYPLPIQT